MIDTQTIFILTSGAISKKSEDSFEIHWTVPASLPYFDGHFPNNPVMPAVAIVDASLEFVKQCSDNNQLTIDKIISCKFVGPIAPNTELKICIENIKTNGEWQAIWKNACSNSPLSELRLSLV